MRAARALMEEETLAGWRSAIHELRFKAGEGVPVLQTLGDIAGRLTWASARRTRFDSAYQITGFQP
jgi:hypothetical protein